MSNKEKRKEILGEIYKFVMESTPEECVDILEGIIGWHGNVIAANLDENSDEIIESVNLNGPAIQLNYYKYTPERSRKIEQDELDDIASFWDAGMRDEYESIDSKKERLQYVKAQEKDGFTRSRTKCIRLLISDTLRKMDNNEIPVDQAMELVEKIKKATNRWLHIQTVFLAMERWTKSEA